MPFLTPDEDPVAVIDEAIEFESRALANYLHAKAAEALFDNNDADGAVTLLMAHKSALAWPQGGTLALLPSDSHVTAMVTRLADLLAEKAEALKARAEEALEGNMGQLRKPERREEWREDMLRHYGSDPAQALKLLEHRAGVLEQRRKLQSLLRADR